MGKDDQRLFDYDLSSPVEAISSLVERPIQDDMHETHVAIDCPGCGTN
jgi:hypothetical protein